MHPTEQWATTNGFGPRKSYTPEAPSTPASRRGPKRLKGLYLVEFENGACYVGMSRSDCARRLIAHGKTYDDVIGFRIQRFTGSVAALLGRECSLIEDAERSGLVVRNRVHASRFGGVLTFDSIVTGDEQACWLDAPEQSHADDAISPAPDLPSSQIEGYRHRWARFSARADAADLAGILGTYLTKTVCYPRRTEAQFWSVSCFPTSDPSKLACVSLHRKNTFILSVDHRGRVQASMFVDGNKLPNGKFRRFIYLRRRGIKLIRAVHVPAQSSQQELSARGAKRITTMVSDPLVAHAAASANIELMRKGRGPHTSTHCFQLARAALDPLIDAEKAAR